MLNSNKYKVLFIILLNFIDLVIFENSLFNSKILVLQ